MVRVHKYISFSDSFYDKFCEMSPKEKKNYLEEMTVFDHLGSKRKSEQIQLILNETPNTRTIRRKAKKADSASDRRGNAEDTAKRQGDNKAKD